MLSPKERALMIIIDQIVEEARRMEDLYARFERCRVIRSIDELRKRAKKIIKANDQTVEALLTARDFDPS